MSDKFKRLLATFLAMIISGFVFPNTNMNVSAEPAGVEVKVSVGEGGGGAVVLPSGGTAHINPGDSITISAEPEESYGFVEWNLSTNGAGSFANKKDSTTQFTVSPTYDSNEPIVIEAVFELPLYNVNLICDPSLGYFEPSAIPPKPAGSRIQFTLKPNHEEQQEKILGVEVYKRGLDAPPVIGRKLTDDRIDYAASITLLAHDMTIKAIFDAPHNITSFADGEGTVETSQQTGIPWQYIYLTATPSQGHQFVRWTSDDVTITNPQSATDATFEMPDKDVSITAVFEEIIITEVALNTDDVKKVYNLGDALNLDNLTMTVSKSDGSTETIPVTEDMVSGFDNSKTGKQIINVTYAGHTMTYEIEVNEKENPTPTPTPPKPNPNNDSADSDTAITTDSESTTSIKKNEEAKPSTGDNRNVLYCIFWISVSTICLISTLRWQRKKKKIKN